jgi:hypothetical protein
VCEVVRYRTDANANANTNANANANADANADADADADADAKSNPRLHQLHGDPRRVGCFTERQQSGHVAEE